VCVCVCVCVCVSCALKNVGMRFQWQNLQQISGFTNIYL